MSAISARSPTPKAASTIQIRDLDQTVIGNPAHDLIRLALSLATAARGSDLPGVTTARMLEQMVEGYAEPACGRIPTPSRTRPKSIRLVDAGSRLRAIVETPGQ